jgi:hypothetical protein
VQKILVPATSAEEWRRVDPPRWQPGNASRALAYCWQEAEGVPEGVHQVLSHVEVFRGFEILLVLPEHLVPLPGGSYPAENDVWALARCKEGLISLAVKGMTREPFGETMQEWLQDFSDGKQRRLDFLCSLLELDQPVPPGIRYPLLKWTASAIMEAVRFHARHAVLLVHSFSPADHWFEDYRAFLSLFGIPAVPGRLVTASERLGIPLHFCWVRGEEEYLKA